MNYLTLQDIKEHLRLDDTWHDEDEILVSIGEAAEAAVIKHIESPLDNLLVNGDLPKPLKHAMLLLVGNFYDNRNSVSYTSVTELPLAYNYLLALYQNYDHISKFNP